MAESDKDPGTSPTVEDGERASAQLREQVGRARRRVTEAKAFLEGRSFQESTGRSLAFEAGKADRD